VLWGPSFSLSDHPSANSFHVSIQEFPFHFRMLLSRARLFFYPRTGFNAQYDLNPELANIAGMKGIIISFRGYEIHDHFFS
jgi:hypothetical protein